MGLDAERRDLAARRLERRRAARADGDARARFRERQSDGPADATAAAGDDGTLAVEVEFHGFLYHKRVGGEQTYSALLQMSPRICSRVATKSGLALIARMLSRSAAWREKPTSRRFTMRPGRGDMTTTSVPR